MSETSEPTADGAEETLPDGSIRVKLSRPTKAFGEVVSALVFRQPTGRDIRSFGNPVIIDFASEPARLSFDEAKMSRMLSALSGVPSSTIDSLSGGDWNACAWGISGFFVPSAPAETS